MTVSNQTNKIRYNGNGATLAFSFPFKIFSESDLKVYLVLDSDGTATLQTISTHYTVAINTSSEGGVVTFLSAPSALYDVLIKRDIDLTQPTDLPAVGQFSEEDVEQELDRGAMRDGQLQEQIDRSLKFSETSDFDDFDVPDPEPLKSFRCNAAGDAFENWEPTLTETEYGGSFSYGLDAAKAASPSTGDIYVAVDVKKIYYCFSAGTWTTILKFDAVVLTQQSSGPTTSTSEGALYTKSVSGVTELFYRLPSNGTEIQLTNNGALNVTLALPKGHLDGGVISNNGSDATNDLDITATVCRSDDDTTDISVAALTKRIDATWVAGTNQGFLDTSTIGGSADLIYIFAIKNPTTGITDYLASKSATSPTMPSGYTKKRLIGARRWTSTAWAVFKTTGNGREKKVFYDEGIQILSSGTQTTFTDVDCGDGGGECVPSTSRKVVLSVRTLPSSGNDSALHLRPNGSAVSASDKTLVLDFQPLASHRISQLIGEFPVDADGIFEYASATNSTGNAWVRGYVEEL